ncbi:hypothetical protein A3A66_02810 [Microgenomates group bacterium RIFCSPLOWO2_01_FULL_46_13]|nr:MAG: hypothetical protein A2783_00095 [Microgenomates group bacterium RIFCSPHIGHO2_01_FULL_45_11]OGV94898.1 MAG: hypothetical protein A3A66_02810 [Microgenomates group bacterium RIFCSPLOWO2_01_FULL_46_13]
MADKRRKTVKAKKVLRFFIIVAVIVVALVLAAIVVPALAQSNIPTFATDVCPTPPPPTWTTPAGNLDQNSDPARIWVILCGNVIKGRVYGGWLPDDATDTSELYTRWVIRKNGWSGPIIFDFAPALITSHPLVDGQPVQDFAWSIPRGPYGELYYLQVYYYQKQVIGSQKIGRDRDWSSSFANPFHYVYLPGINNGRVACPDYILRAQKNGQGVGKSIPFTAGSINKDPNRFLLYYASDYIQVWVEKNGRQISLPTGAVAYLKLGNRIRYFDDPSWFVVNNAILFNPTDNHDVIDQFPLGAETCGAGFIAKDPLPEVLQWMAENPAKAPEILEAYRDAWEGGASDQDALTAAQAVISPSP